MFGALRRPFTCMVSVWEVSALVSGDLPVGREAEWNQTTPPARALDAERAAWPGTPPSIPMPLLHCASCRHDCPEGSAARANARTGPSLAAPPRALPLPLRHLPWHLPLRGHLPGHAPRAARRPLAGCAATTRAAHPLPLAPCAAAGADTQGPHDEGTHDHASQMMMWLSTHHRSLRVI